MTENDMETKEAHRLIAHRLRQLYIQLAAERNTSFDWSLARALEDRIGSGQTVGDDVERAESLLSRYGK